MKNRYFKNVVSLQFELNRCVGCKRCVEVCPHQVFAMADGRCQIKDRDACMECGACVMNCPTEALSVKQGVGCAAAILKSMITGEEASCDCGGDDSPQSCC